jgi:hypothetical protein
MKNAHTVCSDNDWTNLVNQLSAFKANNNTVQVTVTLKDLKGYKNHKMVCI